jgi:hypothetical protein
VVPDVIIWPGGRLMVRCGNESAGSAAIFAGPVDSPELQERMASATPNSATADLTR